MDRSDHFLAHIRLPFPSFNLLRVSVTMLGQTFLEATGIFQILPDSGTGQGSKQILHRCFLPCQASCSWLPCPRHSSSKQPSSSTLEAPEIPQEQSDNGGPQATPDSHRGDVFCELCLLETTGNFMRASTWLQGCRGGSVSQASNT